MRTIRNENVAVVGGCGFLGSHLVEHLIEDRECTVLAIDNLVVGQRTFLHDDCLFEYADITGSEEYLRQLFIKYKIAYVMNYAAYPYIPVSFARPLHVFDVNAVGALKVINAAQSAGVKGILQVSSAEIYGQGSETHDSYSDGCKINERGIVIPHSSYGASKAAVDAMVQVRWKEAKTPCIALRQFNTLGERETHPYIVPEIIGQLKEQTFYDNRAQNQIGSDEDGYTTEEWARIYPPRVGTAQVSLGNNSFRDFLYAGDAVRMAVELLERGEFGEVYNLGSESGVKVYDLAKIIGKLMGFADVEVSQDPARVRPWEIWHLQSNNTKINSVIDYRPTVPLEEGLKRTINWYNANGRKWAWEK